MNYTQSLAYQAIMATKVEFQKIVDTNGAKLNVDNELTYMSQWLENTGPNVWANIDANSVYYAALQAARVGLTLCPFNKLALFVVRNDGMNAYAEYMPTYHGYIKLACDSGLVQQITSSCVFRDDNFTYHGAFKLPDHSTKTLSDRIEDRGELDGSFAIAILNSGVVFCEKLSADELNEIQEKMRMSLNFTVWDSVFVHQMYRKSAIRRLMRLLLPQLAEQSESESYIQRLNGAMAGEDSMWDKIQGSVGRQHVIDNNMPPTPPSNVQAAPSVASSTPQNSVTNNNGVNIHNIQKLHKINHKNVVSENTDLMAKLVKNESDVRVFETPSSTDKMPTKGLGEW